MSFAGPDFVLAIIAISTVGWIINNWIRARHGYALEDEWGGKTPRADDQAMVALREENAVLRQQLEATHQRLANVEAIVTDRGFDVAGQIEALRRQDGRSAL
ncbi:MAG: hypothetical protein B7Y36_11525 [Novosphingobium sp. 28-62-57]|uniref:hypothetical protein n=1 Tax=unclassified Novosphingobium TaxID=2644732 RepID=UPI000BCA8CE6|nr:MULTISPECIES: hypothetical protein [unclassified Novosphingobium]OYW50858.1 MAG: hypothetical protein B7Z34_03310 [Novosphingobium sp. 12-62-10]OYZ10004.1 MAG: hypothetical protein B7Y36_11525 [Novosphingobium sp. 28-62-57]OYZ99042.1 MAG: hypothetical protein B7X96_00245 [Novosphingobium sp. 17-62-8]HQS70583.1 hypothetical protein [Novosphingobium sp.]